MRVFAVRPALLLVPLLWGACTDKVVEPTDTDVVDTDAPDTDVDVVVDTDTAVDTCPSGPVIVGNVLVTTPYELDALNCVTRITGSLTLEGPDLSSLSSLSLLTTIGGDLNVHNNQALTSLDGLDQVTSIGGALHIDGNPVLASLAGLGGLSDVGGVQVGGGLHIGDCPALTSLSGLGGLTAIGGYLDIHHNTSLATLYGLESLKTVTGDMFVDDNPVLCDADIDRLVAQLDHYAGFITRANNGTSGAGTSCGAHVGDVFAADIADLCLSHLNLSIDGSVDLSDVTDLTPLRCIDHISGSLRLRCNPGLATLRGLENLLTVGGDLEIVGNDTLYNLEGLESLVSVGGDLVVSGNAVLHNLSGTDARGSGAPIQRPGLDALTTIGGDLLLGGVDVAATCPSVSTVGNPALGELGGLKGLVSLGGGVRIEDQHALASLSGLSGLLSLGGGGGLTVRRNDALTNLVGFEGLTLANDVEVSDNSALTSLQGLEALESVSALTVKDNPSLQSLFPLARLGAIGGSFTLTGNPVLANLGGLEELRSVGGDLLIQDDVTLVSLIGLDKLYSVGRVLSVVDNDALITLRGLDGIRSAPTLSVQRNPLLCDADVDRVLEQLQSAPSLTRTANDGACAVWPPTGQGTVITGGFTNLCTGPLWNLTIHGGVNIGPRETAADVSAMWCVTHIEGDLSIRSSTLSTLDAVDGMGRHGFGHLVEIGGTLEIRGDNNLRSLSGLGTLQTVGLDLDIEDNLSLRNLVGLDKLTQVGGLRISGNASLNSLSGLSTLTDVTGRLYVADNALLTTLSGLDGLGTVGGDVTVTGNPSLCSDDLDAFALLFPTCTCNGGTVSTCAP